MKYLSVTETAKLWNISARSIRNYCAQGRIKGAFLTGKTWNIPEDSTKPKRKNKNSSNILLELLKEQKKSNTLGDIYQKLQMDLVHTSVLIKNKKINIQQICQIFNGNSIQNLNETVTIDDLIEISNHFKCFDFVIDNATKPLTESFIKHLHFILKTGTSDSRKSWYNVGAYKTSQTQINGIDTCAPNAVSREMKTLIENYNNNLKTIDNIVKFHKMFEQINPFQDGNSRLGRLIMLKECLANNFTPIVIDKPLITKYLHSLHNNKDEQSLIDVCKTAQNELKQVLANFDFE